MKSRLFLTIAAAGLFLSALSYSALSLSVEAESPEVGDVAPNWTLESADGTTVRLSREVREQPVIILFWATWCPYCKALMPHLQSIELEYGDEIQVLAVNFRDKGDPVGFIKNAGYDFTVLPDGGDVAALYDVWGTPGVIIVDQDQRIRFDLRDLPPYQADRVDGMEGHSQKAAFRAPYWAAEIRKAISQLDLISADCLCCRDDCRR